MIFQEKNYTEDEKLWIGLRNGDMVSYNRLIKKYFKPLFNFSYRFCQDRDILKDCIQELFLDLWNKRHDLIQPNSVKSYLFKAVRNRVIREQGKWNKNQSLGDDYDFILEFSIEEKIIDDTQSLELAIKIKNILELLPPRQREIVYLRFYENLDLDQIMHVMGISRQSAHNLLQKAYKSIRLKWVIALILLSFFLQS